MTTATHLKRLGQLAAALVAISTALAGVTATSGSASSAVSAATPPFSEPLPPPQPAPPPGTFGRWPGTPTSQTVYYHYRSPHRYLGNMVQAATNWKATGVSIGIARWPGIPREIHISVLDLEAANDWYGLVVTRGGCEPPRTDCVFTRNTILLNRDLLDSRNDFFRTKTTTHELGHALGLCHQTGGSCGVNIGAGVRSIMQPGGILMDAPYNSPQPHDVKTIRWLYP